MRTNVTKDLIWSTSSTFADRGRGGWGGLEGGVTRDGAPWGSNFFMFMQFSCKKFQQRHHQFGNWRPHLRKILDPPLLYYELWLLCSATLGVLPGVDPVFPVGVGAYSRRGANIQFCQKNSQKLNKIEKVSGYKRGRMPETPP